MSGLRLASMEASDMLDVIHYIFEEDTVFFSTEHAAYKDQLRTNLFRDMYKSDYKYVNNSGSSTDNNYGLDSLDEPLSSDSEPAVEEKIKIFSPREKTSKPYTPPTAVLDDDSSPFGSILDSPIN